MHRHEIEILKVLDERGGFTTAKVAEQANVGCFHNKRQRSGAVRSWLLKMKEAGLVRMLDDQKPDAWCRTPQGSEALMLGMKRRLTR